MRMSSPATLPHRKPSENEQAALLRLLADDDAGVYRAIRERVVSLGPESRDWLRPHVLSSDAVLRRRAREIVQYFDRQEADTRFLAYCLKPGETFDLEKAAWMLARTRYPDINVEAYRAILDDYASELRAQLDFGAGAERILGTVNEHLFDDLGFAGNEENYYDIENSYLNRVMDRRTGNPISLCLLYMLVTRRLALPVTGIGLPGHFVCRYQSSSDEFYIDAFNRGRLLSKADCVQYLLRGNYSLRDDFLSPMSPRRILMRMCSNLHKICTQFELAEEATRLQRYIIALGQ